MLLSEIYQLIGNFIIDISNSDTTVKMAHDNLPRPLKPFITIDIKNMERIGWPIDANIDQTNTLHSILQKKFVLELRSYCDQLHQAEDLLINIENKFTSYYAYEFFNSSGNSIAYNKTISGVTAIPIELKGQSESRAILETEFYVCQEVSEIVDVIEHVEIINVTQNERYTIDK